MSEGTESESAAEKGRSDPAGGSSLVFCYSFAYFVLFAVYGVASPYLPILLRGLDYGPAAIGFLLGIFEVVGIAGPLFIARAADARGAYKLALLGSAACVAAGLLPLVLLRSPLAAGFGIALLALGLKTLIPVMDAAAVGVGEYGKLRSLGSAGFVVMALFLQLLPGFDSAAPSRIASWMGGAAAAFAAVLLFLPGASPKAGPSARPLPRPYGDAPRGGARLPSGFDSAFALGIVVIGLGRLSMAPVSSFISLYAVEGVGWNAVGALWAIAAFSEIPLMALSGAIVARIGAMRAISIGSMAIVVRLAVYALFPSPAGLVAGQLLHSLCFGLFHPAAVAFVAQRVDPTRRATGMAIYMGIGVGLPTFIGSALGGLVVEAYGYRILFGSFSAFALLGLALYVATRKRFGSR